MIAKVTGTEVPIHVTIVPIGDKMTRMTRRIIFASVANRENTRLTRARIILSRP